MSSFAVKYPQVASFGHSVSHAKNRHSRTFKYNLHTVNIIDEKGKKVRLRLPAKMIKNLKKAGVTSHFRKKATDKSAD